MKRTLAIAAAAGAIAFSSAAFAVPQWCIAIGGPPCEGGPGGGEEAAGNNLSLPTKFVPDTNGAPELRTLEDGEDPCPVAAEHYAPGWDGQPPTFPPELPVYWVQKTAATWSADCALAGNDETVDVSADWGDNLTGDAPEIKSGKPVRVEVSLTQTNAEGGPYTGYVVLKLTDDLDRLATYGTKGDPLTQNWRVWDAGASLTIASCTDTSCETSETIITEDPITAEINSTGGVVYGYNWGTKQDAPDPGTYLLTFYANKTNITSVADGNLCDLEDNCTYVIVTLSPGGGGGGGGNPNRP